jgi:hypothetical protein
VLETSTFDSFHFLENKHTSNIDPKSFRAAAVRRDPHDRCAKIPAHVVFRMAAGARGNEEKRPVVRSKLPFAMNAGNPLRQAITVTEMSYN